MTDSEKHPWESDPDAWKEPVSETAPNNPGLRVSLSEALDDYVPFLEHQNGLEDDTGMSDQEWLYLSQNVLSLILSKYSAEPDIASRDLVQHLIELISAAEESCRYVGVIEKRVRIDIVDTMKSVRGGLKE